MKPYYAFYHVFYHKFDLTSFLRYNYVYGNYIIFLIFIIFLLNIFEWYDYALYIILKKYIDLYFLGSKNIVLWVFAIGYITRAIGGVYFALIAKKNTNLYSISIATSIMLICTLCIGILPSYSTFSYYGIYILRMIQGFALGGVMSLSIVTLLDYANDKKWYYNRGLLTSLPIASVPLGIIFADIISHICMLDFWTNNIFYTEVWENIYNTYSWRLPFLFSLLGCIFSYYLYIESERKEGICISYTDLHFIWQAISNSWLSILLTLCIAGINGVGFYFTTSYLIPQMFSEYSYILYILITLSCITSAYYATIYTDLVYYIIGFIILSFATFIYGFIFNHLNIIHYAGLLITILIGGYIGIEGLLHTSLYNPIYRRIAFAFAYNLAMFLFGGTTPLLTRQLFNKDYILYFGLYIAFICIIAIISIASRKYITHAANSKNILKDTSKKSANPNN